MTSVALEYAYRHLAEVGLAWRFCPQRTRRCWRADSASWPPSSEPWTWPIPRTR